MCRKNKLVRFGELLLDYLFALADKLISNQKFSKRKDPRQMEKVETMPKLYSVADIAKQSKVSPKWVQKLAPELIEKGHAQRVGKVLVCIKSAAGYIRKRTKAKKPGRPKGSTKGAFAGVYSRTEKNGKIIYILKHVDGAEEILRTSSRKYDLAHYYREPVTGANKSGIRRHFTFGKNPDRIYAPLLVTTFAIDHN